MNRGMRGWAFAGKSSGEPSSSKISPRYGRTTASQSCLACSLLGAELRVVQVLATSGGVGADGLEMTVEPGTDPHSPPRSRNDERAGTLKLGAVAPPPRHRDSEIRARGAGGCNRGRWADSDEDATETAVDAQCLLRQTHSGETYCPAGRRLSVYPSRKDCALDAASPGDNALPWCFIPRPGLSAVSED